jgi:hypothetical protein
LPQNTEEGFRLAHLTPLALLCSLSRQRILPRQGVCVLVAAQRKAVKSQGRAMRMLLDVRVHVVPRLRA